MKETKPQRGGISLRKLTVRCRPAGARCNPGPQSYKDGAPTALRYGSRSLAPKSRQCGKPTGHYGSSRALDSGIWKRCFQGRGLLFKMNGMSGAPGTAERSMKVAVDFSPRMGVG